MSKPNVTMNVRQLAADVAVIEIVGELNGEAEGVLMDAYKRANQPPVQSLLLNFQKLSYMNSSGIGLLVTLLVRAQRKQQRLLACGLSEHYQQIFAITRLNEVISLHPSEAEAVASL